jgi:hypothetical protein
MWGLAVGSTGSSRLAGPFGDNQLRLSRRNQSVRPAYLAQDFVNTVMDSHGNRRRRISFLVAARKLDHKSDAVPAKWSAWYAVS